MSSPLPDKRAVGRAALWPVMPMGMGNRVSAAHPVAPQEPR
jgi:hypothetical protein